ncbi:MAG: hypothetical protein NVSMB26_16500 [Beijerinckiaceae bacterium]
MRLSRRPRWLAYAVVAVLLATGALWIAADRLKESEAGEFWQSVAANTLMVHGGAAMAMLILIGALIPLHVQRSWRGEKNRATGMAMIAVNAFLVVTAFGLYYLASPVLRPWASDLHLVFGFALPILLAFHIVVGRRTKT